MTDNSRRRPKFLLALLAGCALVSGRCLAAHKVVYKDVILNLKLAPDPELIVRATNGDFILVGRGDNGDGHAWAARIDPNGQLMWEHTAGQAMATTDYAQHGLRLYGAVDLPNHGTLLCGVRGGAAWFIIVGSDGSLIDQRKREAARPGSRVIELRCSPWGDGYAVAGKVTGESKATGWLFKLDAKDRVVWEKYADYYSYGDMMEAAGGGLFLISWDAGLTSVVKVDSAGEMVFGYPLPRSSSEWRLVHPSEPRSNVRVAYMLSQTKTDLIDLDEQARLKHIWHLSNVGLKAALETSSGSIVVLGSEWHNIATAAFTIVDGNGSFQHFVMQPPYASHWFLDAVHSGSPNELATVRQVGASFQLTWVSIN